MESMEALIEKLLVDDSTVIQKATADLQEAFKDPETIPALCDVVVYSAKSNLRQYSAMLLKKRLRKLRHWQLVVPKHQQALKQLMLNALVQEHEKSVRTAIAQLVGVLVRHESSRPDCYMGKVLKLIFSYCKSSDPKESELGSSIFATLMDVATDQFGPYMESVCEMFTAALNGNVAGSPVILNIISGMTYLVPLILGHNAAEQTFQKSVPLVIKSLQAFAMQSQVDQFVRAFDFLESMADFTPKLLTLNIKLLMQFCLETSNNAQLDSAIRVKTVYYIGWLVRLKKKVIIKQKFVEPIIKVVFNLMSSEPDGDFDNEDYFLGEDGSNPMTTATHTMDMLALNVPAHKLIPPLLTLIELAFLGQDPLPRRAAYLTLAGIAEGCSETICNKYLELMLNLIKAGITDPTPIIRNAAFYALGQFSEYLQPKISTYAPQILPILFQFLQQLCSDLKSGGCVPKHIDRMFYALKTYCEYLEDGLVPYLPMLMEGLFEALNPANDVRVRELSLRAIAAAAIAAKENMMPFFNRLITMLKTYLDKTDEEEINTLRTQAITTLAAISRNIGKQNFMPLATETMTFALRVLEEADDTDVRRALYELIASVAEVVNENMALVLPKVMDQIYDSILCKGEVIPKLKYEDNDEDEEDEDDADDDDDTEFDLVKSDDENDDLENGAGDTVDSSFMNEKEEAIETLKAFAVHTGAAFIPYMEQSYENVYKMLDHPQEDIRNVSIETLTAFIMALYKQKDLRGVTNAVGLLIPKLGQIVRTDEEMSVVLTSLENLDELLKELKEIALPNETMADIFFTCINDVMMGKVACQFDEPDGVGDDNDAEDSEFDESIIEYAGIILSHFGFAMQPEKFSMYFSRIYPIIVQKLQKTKNRAEYESQRSFTYTALADCFSALHHCTATYFDILCPLMIGGLSDSSQEVRQNAAFGLGELVLYSEEKSYKSYPIILNALSQAVANETEAGALDNICGAIARMIITNNTLVPLPQVLPVFLQYLPLRIDYVENNAVFECLNHLFRQSHELIYSSLEQILAITIHVLHQKQYTQPETLDNAMFLLKEIRDKHPGTFALVANSSPEIMTFLNTI